nr:cecropin-1 [Hepialus xiaojinensis]
MNFTKILLAVAMLFSLILAGTHADPQPGWNPFKKLEKVGRNIRDGLVKASPAIQVIGDAQQVYRQG